MSWTSKPPPKKWGIKWAWWRANSLEDPSVVQVDARRTSGDDDVLYANGTWSHWYGERWHEPIVPPQRTRK